MPHKLYVIHGSHPCATVERALALKGVPHRRIELPPPPLHGLIQRLRFGRRTVPAIELDGGERIVGSRAILHRLEELAPQPPLYGADAGERRRVENAEEWGDEVWQPVVRRLLAPALQRRPAAITSYFGGAALAPPAPLLRLAAPAAVRVSRALNEATDEAARADLAALPTHLDRIDAWIAGGLLGGERPNAADLQIAPTSRMLLTIGDVAPFFDGRPAREHALALFPAWAGEVPAGTLPADWPAAARPRVAG